MTRNLKMSKSEEKMKTDKSKMNDVEWHRLLVEWNATEASYPRDWCVHHLFEAQAEQTPDNIAVIFEGEQLTYAELNQKANKLAHHLMKLGVEPEVLVGIFMERSLEMMVGLLSILKAGGAYVPLDPEFPKARVAYMMNHAKVSVLLTQQQLSNKLPENKARLLCLDTEWEIIAKESEENPISKSSPDNLAYVIYTSGSTGNPKGVQVPHGAAVNFLSSMLTKPGITEQDVMLAVTTLSFDIAVLELFLPLIVGATVMIANTIIASNGEALLNALIDSHVTIMQATPVTWHLLVSAGWKGSSQFKVLCGGDVLQRDLMCDLIQRAESVWNMYGPTETTVWSTCCRLKDVDGPVMIGRPIANTQVYILDNSMQPVLVGEPGELYIGGKGVTRGYLHQPELTTRQFLPDPFSKDPNARIYKTGDLARYLPDGNLVLIGRLDHQIKLRGYRIEVGEIESALGTYPAINQVVVMIREDEPGDRRLVAYLVPHKGKRLITTELRRYLMNRLPDYMIPSIFVILPKMPLTLNRKIDRKSLPPPDKKRPKLEQKYVAPSDELERDLSKIWCKVLKLDRVGIHDNFFELGGNSLLAQMVVAGLNQFQGIEISVVKLFQYLTISALVRYLNGEEKEQFISGEIQEKARPRRMDEIHDHNEVEGVAIIGMAGRFPGADSIDTLWKNLCNGVESITFFADEEIDLCVEESLRNDANYIKARGIIKDADKFDPAFFGISPREAEVMDPQQRVFLELVWTALEKSGYESNSYNGLIGVFAGMGNNHYYHLNVSTRPDLVKMIGEFQVEIGNEKDHIATRVSHKLNLTGPSVSIHTACSTGLVVVDAAFHSLVHHQCDMALAGAVDINIPQNSGQLHQAGGVFTKDGHCRPFDEQATGTMFCDGSGVVVLKRLRDAWEDGDTIYAVIKGSATNNDGANKASYLGPSVDGQINVITAAQECANVEPDSISYIEAHGTGTPVGDPIEVEALTRVFRAKTAKKQFCAIGSIKGNVGHPTSAAGIVGVIKVALALYHKKIPPQVNFNKPNPRIDFQNSPFYVNTKLLNWPEGTTPRRAGVSSFGFGGTNAHAIIEEAPKREPSGSSRSRQLLLLSAKTESSLEKATTNLSEYLEQHPEINLADVSYTLQTGRKAFDRRRYVVCKDTNEGVVALKSLDANLVSTRHQKIGEPKLAFMFPGQGAQYVNMGLNLYQHEPLFRETVDKCAQILMPHLGCDLRDLLYPDKNDLETAAKSLKETFFTQPAIFTIEYALSKLWESWGIHPQAMIGHSIGEFVCACLSEVFSLEDALFLVATRGRLMQSLPGGSMLSVRLPAEKVENMLIADLSIAAINGPSLCVISGPTDTVSVFQKQLEDKKIVCRHLHTSHAFHSAMMDSIIEPFAEHVRSIKLSPPTIPFVSTVTSRWISAEMATDPIYWARHLRATVRLAEGIKELLNDSERVLLEVGPRRITTTLALQQMKDTKTQVAISSLSDTSENDAEWTALLKAIGQLWLNGISIDWKSFYKCEKRHKVALPTYPFDRKRFWIEPAYYRVNAGINVAPPEQPVQESTNKEEIAGNGKEETRQKRIVPLLREILSDASGIDLEGVDDFTTFMEMGMDSLLLTQVAFNIQSKFGVKVAFRQLLEELSTLNRLSEFIEQQTSPDSLSDEMNKGETATSPVQSQSISVDNSDLTPQKQSLDTLKNDGTGKIISKQLEIISRLLAILEKGGSVPTGGSLASLATPEPGVQEERKSEEKTEPHDKEVISDTIKEQSLSEPPVPGAKLGRDPDGKPAWYVSDPDRPGKYLQVAEVQ